MHNITKIEDYFKEFIDNICKSLPEGVIQIDIDFLQEYQLLNFHQDPSPTPLTQYFHVIETPQKITLINDKFAIWILPQNIEHTLTTSVYIALHLPDDTMKMELGFVAKGVYNNSKLVLKVLERLLFEIEENETFLKDLTNCE